MHPDQDKYRGHVRTAILCDDIRREITKKYLLIGVFSGDIVVGEMPASIAPQLYLEYVPDEVGEFEMTVRFLFNGTQKAKLGGKLRVVNTDGTIAMPLPPALLELDEPGTLEVEFNREGAQPEVVVSKIVKVGEVTPPTGVSQRPAQSPDDAQETT